MRALIIVCTIYLLSCKLVNNDLPNKNENIHINTDSINKVDSMKWVFYSMNYLGKALFYDSLRKVDIKFETVACDVTLDEYKQVTKDSSYYIFSFSRPGYRFRYVDLSVADGIGVCKNNIYPIVSHGRYDFQENQDSINTFMAKSDTAFRKYIKNYSGELSRWLKQEALRRNVLQ